MSRRYQILAWVLLFCFTAGLVYLNLITPLWSDDYVYRFVFDAKHYYDESFSRLVSSWADIRESQVAHYCCTNGRLVAHTLAQIFLFCGQGWLWSVLNSLCFVATVWLLWRFACHGGRGCRDAGQRWAGFLLTLALYWLLLPHPGQLFFWLTGSCNYQWSALLVLLFLNLLFLPAPRSVAWLLFPLALLAGNGNEALSLGLAASLFVHAVFRRHELERRQLAGLLCFWLGTASNVFSPGAAARLEMAGDSVTSASAAERLTDMCSDLDKVFAETPALLVVPLAALVLSVLPWWGRARCRGRLFMAALISLALALYVRMLDPRATFGFYLYASLAALPVVLGIFASLPRWCRLAVGAALAAVSGQCMLNAAYDIPRFAAYEQSVVQAARAGCGFVVPEQAAPYSRYNHSTFITQNSVGMHNRALAAYFGTPPFGLLRAEEWAEVQAVPDSAYRALEVGEHSHATEGIFLMRLPEMPSACHVTGYWVPEDARDARPRCWGGLACSVVEREGGLYLIIFFDGNAHEAGLCELRVRLMEGHRVRSISLDPCAECCVVR